MPEPVKPSLNTLTALERLELRSLASCVSSLFQRYAEDSSALSPADLTTHTVSAQTLVDALADAGITQSI